MLGAIEAQAAGGGVQGNDTHSLLEAANSRSYFFDGAGQFVPEQGGGNDHAGVIAALVNL